MKGNWIRSLVTMGLLVAVMFAMVTPAEALQDLKITSDNLAYLEDWSARGTPWYWYGCCIEPRLLKYDWGVSLNTHGGSKTAIYIGSMKGIKIRDGQCVLFANALADRNGKIADDWERGAQVMSIIGTIKPGTLVATFSDEHTYSGHVAIYARRHWKWSGSEWQVDGFDVWDQNFVSPLLVGGHSLIQSGSGVYNANNYYVVRGPP